MTHGGKREGAGRPKGVISEAKRQIADMAKEHGPTALQTLVDIATTGEGESARVAASNAILDRAYGRPLQSMDVSNSDRTFQTVDVSKLSMAERKALLAAMILGEDELPTNEG